MAGSEKRKIIRFNLTPISHLRTTQGDRIYFRIPRDKLYPAGLKRLLRIERYNEYKSSLKEIAHQQQFVLPHQGAHIRFYLPVPKTWSQKKKDRYHGTPHQSRSDLDNLCKAFFDALFEEDKHISHFQASKRWVDFESGWIEVEINDPVMPDIPKE